MRIYTTSIVTMMLLVLHAVGTSPCTLAPSAPPRIHKFTHNTRVVGKRETGTFLGQMLNAHNRR